MHASRLQTIMLGLPQFCPPGMAFLMLEADAPFSYGEALSCQLSLRLSIGDDYLMLPCAKLLARQHRTTFF